MHRSRRGESYRTTAHALCQVTIPIVMEESRPEMTMGYVAQLHLLITCIARSNPNPSGVASSLLYKTRLRPRPGRRITPSGDCGLAAVATGPQVNTFQGLTLLSCSCRRPGCSFACRTDFGCGGLGQCFIEMAASRSSLKTLSAEPSGTVPGLERAVETHFQRNPGWARRCRRRTTVG